MGVGDWIGQAIDSIFNSNRTNSQPPGGIATEHLSEAQLKRNQENLKKYGTVVFDLGNKLTAPTVGSVVQEAVDDAAAIPKALIDAIELAKYIPYVLLGVVALTVVNAANVGTGIQRAGTGVQRATRGLI